MRTTAPAPPGQDLGLLTVAEAAAKMRLCEKTVQRRIDAEVYPSVRVGRGVRVPSRWLDGLIADAITLGTVCAEDHGRAWIAANQGA